jgi:2-polyprenyl-3-methyl-5-hydroxy-6-metoxy-1,4-benzoquinol methylase
MSLKNVKNQFCTLCLAKIISLEKKFDMIFCMEVSEYLYDPLTALKNMHFLLKDKGTL